MIIPDSWTFKDAEIASNFDAHVNEQVPWYGLASFCVSYLVSCYLKNGGVVYDIGSSTGNIINLISKTAKERNATIISIDESLEMIQSQDVSCKKICCPAESFIYEPHSVSVLFLSLSFICPSKRKPLLIDLIRTVDVGGAIIIIDKFSFPEGSGYIETCLKRMTVSFKVKNNIPPDEIIKKELSISGVSRPVDFYMIKELGFKAFFKIGEFDGYIYEK